MIKEMITLDAAARPTFDTLLHTSRGTVFPESFFSFLHNYVASVNENPASPPFTTAAPSSVVSPVATGPSPSGTVGRPSTSGPAVTVLDDPSDLLPSDSDHRMERIWADYESVEPYLVPDDAEETATVMVYEDQSSTNASKPFQVTQRLIIFSFLFLRCVGCPSR